MRRARLSWEGAFHHIMNRGINGTDIFSTDEQKKEFLNILSRNLRKYRMRLFTYCILDNHYHLILRNESGRLSDFMKNLNGTYGHYYRKSMNSHGYVFQDRFKSTIIENDHYLIQCIGYVLQNPVRASICKKANQYLWSSINIYFSHSAPTWIDNQFIEDLLESRSNLLSIIEKDKNYELNVKNTGWGGILGSTGFLGKAVKRYNRRKKRESQERKRYDDLYFEPVEKVIQEFEKKHGLKIDTIDTSCWEGKRLRGELLIHFKDLCGLKYHEIARFDLFSDLQPNSLKSIYQNSKKKR